MSRLSIWHPRTAALLIPFHVIASAAVAAPVTYRLDPAHSAVHFEVRHFGTSTLRGRFAPIEGEVRLDREARRGEVGLRFATATVDTGVGPLDARLRQADLLASTEYPEAYFVSSSFEFDAQGAVTGVRGEFTLRGISLPLALRAKRYGCHSHPSLGRQVCGGDFTAELRRSAYGASFGAPFVGDTVRLVIQVEGVAEAERRDAP